MGSATELVNALAELIKQNAEKYELVWIGEHSLVVRDRSSFGVLSVTVHHTTGARETVQKMS